MLSVRLSFNTTRTVHRTGIPLTNPNVTDWELLKSGLINLTSIGKYSVVVMSRKLSLLVLFSLFLSSCGGWRPPKSVGNVENSLSSTNEFPRFHAECCPYLRVVITILMT